MTLNCVSCGKPFGTIVVIDGWKLNFWGRGRCFECLPYRPRPNARRGARRPPRIMTCQACGAPFAAKQIVDGVLRSLYRRRFCLNCSPFGAHNTSPNGPHASAPDDVRAARRRRRSASQVRYGRKKRNERKRAAAELRGGRCADCGYRGCIAVLEFHHRDRRSKEFSIGGFTGSWERLLAELDKCDLICANCHRLRHARRDIVDGGAVVEFRRRTKLRAVSLMGSLCMTCGRAGPPALFEFHHVDATQKDFGISETGVPRRWGDVVAELAKCVLLCANCHREVHAGVRSLEDLALLGLAEPEAAYVA